MMRNTSALRNTTFYNCLLTFYFWLSSNIIQYIFEKLNKRTEFYVTFQTLNSEINTSNSIFHLNTYCCKFVIKREKLSSV